MGCGAKAVSEVAEATIAVGQAAIDIVLGADRVLRSNSSCVSHSQTICFGGEVDAFGGTIRQQIGGRIWFDCGRFNRSQ